MTTVDSLDKEFARIINDFAEATEEVLLKATNETADDTIQELRNAHPAGAEQYGSWDAYNNDWKKNTARLKKGLVNSTVYNKSHYQLTHLLEFGHAKQNGGRTRAFPHIAPVAEKVEQRILEHIEQGLQNDIR